ncbi:MAG: Methyltransferase type 12 [Leptospirillum sp. Group IV 'UBA BS']|nr:MAG: Methyltransferase type 12 [Leptospirillum sp. Group IV 'UBA BS']
MANKKSRNVSVIEELSRGFTQRDVPEAYMDDPDLRRAYGAYFGEVGLEKGAALSREIRNLRRPCFGGKDRLSMVDLGSGTGEFARGLSEGLLPEVAGGIDLLCVDRSREALKELSARWVRPAQISLRIRPCLLPDSDDLFDEVETVDVLSMANLLAENEDRLSGFLDLLAGFLERLSPEGLMVLVEPADRLSSRALLGLGDRLLDLSPDLHILAPCPNDRRGPCPSLSSPDGWCHEDRPVTFSQSLTRTAATLGHIKDSLKMTYLLLARPLPGTEEPGPPSLRLVSQLHKEKGLSWGIFCNGSSLVRLRLLNRYRNDGTRAFARLRRGESILDPGLSSLGSGGPPESFVDWPAGSSLVGWLRSDGTPWDLSREEE